MYATTSAEKPQANGLPTMIHVLHRRMEERGDNPALHRKSGTGWEAISWKRYGQLVQRFARALMAHGVGPGDRVAILGFNRLEWVVADLGAMAAGAVPVGIYTTSSPEQAAWILEHCSAPVILVENRTQLEKIRAVKERLPALKLAILMEPDPAALELSWVRSFDAFLADGDEIPVSRYDEAVASLEPSGLATLIYTSGTTGPPKGVMISHHNLRWTAERLTERLGVPEEERVISYLPLSHIAEQLTSIHLAIWAGVEVYFAESIEAIRDHLAEVRPTVFLGVPRLWEKIQGGIQATVATAPPARQRIFDLARRVGSAYHRSENPGLGLRVAHAFFDRLVYSKLRARLGLDRCRYAVSSTAPLHPVTLDFFWSLGIPIHQIYGQSEVTGPTSVEVPEARRFGSVGQALPGVELRIAGDGEVLVRGANVFLGYFRDEAATREMIDPDGWLHSGDVGRLDEEGFLWITDRKKELIVTSGGKKTGPAYLEGLLQAVAPVGHAVVVGDGRKYLAALLTLDPVAAGSWAAERGIPFTGVAGLADDPRLREHIARAIAEEINPRLAQFETIKRFSVLPVEFATGENGELTPTLKLRRKATAKKYADAVEALYAEPPPPSVTASASR